MRVCCGQWVVMETTPASNRACSANGGGTVESNAVINHQLSPRTALGGVCVAGWYIGSHSDDDDDDDGGCHKLSII